MVASYVGQATAAVAGIVMLPVFVHYLGTEAYGLVGFFTMLQSWSMLLDMGMTPTLSRELARFSAGVLTQQRMATMIRTMEWIFIGLGLVCASSVILLADWSAHHWLKARNISRDEYLERLQRTRARGLRLFPDRVPDHGPSHKTPSP